MTASFVRTVLAAGLLALLPGVLPAQDAPARRRSTPNLITAEEIAERTPTAQQAQEIIERLRPQWLRPRRGTSQLSGGATAPRIQVYVQDIRQSGTDVLATIPREQIYELRFVPGVDASARYGLDHELGAILVRTTPPQ